MDLSDELLATVRADFDKQFRNDTLIRELATKIQTGSGTYADASSYAERVGDLLAKAFQDNLSADMLPDRKMIKEMAEKIIKKPLQDNHQIITEATRQAQESLNESAGLGLSAEIPAFNEDRAEGIIDKVCEYDDFDLAKWLLDEPVVNFSMNIVDESVKENADFQYEAGLSPKIIRTAERKCCDWCSARVGEFPYAPDMSREVFRRHRFCRCLVMYNPADGKNRMQNAHTKKWN